MRPRVIVLVLLAACGSSTVEAPPLTVPTGPHDLEDEAEGFAIDPAAPYAKLFVEGASWKLPTTVWLGAEPKPEVTCAISAVQKFPAAMVAHLGCTTPTKIGPLSSALADYGVVATDDGLWITSNAGVIEPAPTTADELTTLLATQPIRLAVKPIPIHDARVVEQPGTRPIQVEATIDAVQHGDAWCLTDENTAGSETVTSVLCLRAKDGLVGALASYRSHGIVFGALAWGDGPLPAPSGPYEIELAAPPEEVTLDNPGKGKRAPLTLVATVGAEQPVQYVLEGKTRMAATPDDGKSGEVAHPTMTLRGTARVESVDPDGSFRYVFTMTDITATGATAKPQLTDSLRSLDGLVYLAVISPDGRVVAAGIHVEHPTTQTPALVAELVQGMTTFTVLPKEPIGVGARWTSHRASRMLDHDGDVTITSRLDARKAGRAVIVSTSSIEPYVQAVPKGTMKVEGRGTLTTQMVTGALVPLRTDEFALSVVVEPSVAGEPRRTVALTTRRRVLPK